MNVQPTRILRFKDGANRVTFDIADTFGYWFVIADRSVRNVDQPT